MANQKLKINFSEEDLDELRSGGTHDWTFTTDKGEPIDIHLYCGYDSEDGTVCEKCGLPVVIYMCKKCEIFGEEEQKPCVECGKEMVVDNDYHKNCS